MNKSFMLQAFREAELGVRQNHGGPFGAIVVKDNKIVGWGHNKVPSLNDPTAHAEIMAIRDACQRLGTFDLSDCILYTTCEPCPMCLCSILWARIPQVYFVMTRFDAANIGFDDSYFYGLFNMDYEASIQYDTTNVRLLPEYADDEIISALYKLIDAYRNNARKVMY